MGRGAAGSARAAAAFSEASRRSVVLLPAPGCPSNAGPRDLLDGLQDVLVILGRNLGGLCGGRMAAQVPHHGDVVGVVQIHIRGHGADAADDGAQGGVLGGLGPTVRKQ
jgi:hypothetical protein